MSSQLNIKDAETNSIIDELARLTGRSKTEVVRHSVRVELESLKTRQQEEFERIIKLIRPLQRRAAALLRPGEILDEASLYDENGFPK